MCWFPLSVLCLTLDLIFEAADTGALVYFRDEHREFNKKQLDTFLTTCSFLKAVDYWSIFKSPFPQKIIEIARKEEKTLQNRGAIIGDNSRANQMIQRAEQKKNKTQLYAAYSRVTSALRKHTG